MRKCEQCNKELTKRQSYNKTQRFCSSKCRSLFLPMPPRPDRTGATPWNKGKTWPELAAVRNGSSNPNWKGDDVGYSQLHKWVRKRLVKPKECQNCGKVRVLHMSNISYEYKRDLSDWIYLCVPCHSLSDRTSGNWGDATKRYNL